MGIIIKNGISYSSAGGGVSGSDMQVLTQAEYDALVATGAVNDNIYYFIEDETKNGARIASDISYSNYYSGLDANNLQDAVDLVENEVTELGDKMVRKITVTSTTTASGTFKTNIDTTKYDIISARVMNVANTFAFPRNDEYLMCFQLVNTQLSPCANVNYTIDVWVVKK